MPCTMRSSFLLLSYIKSNLQDTEVIKVAPYFAFVFLCVLQWNKFTNNISMWQSNSEPMHTDFKFDPQVNTKFKKDL